MKVYKTLSESRSLHAWAENEDAVIPLERNFYGHPLPGLLWGRHFEEAWIELGLEKISNWECVFVHRKQGLFLSVHVDDIKNGWKKKSSHVEESDEKYGP